MTPKLATPPLKLISTLSYTHIAELLACDTVEKRVSYQTQCIAGGWSVRELKRQINSFLFERSELSTDKQPNHPSPIPFVPCHANPLNTIQFGCRIRK